MRTPLCVVSALMFSSAAIGAETASQALAKVAPLASTAAANMDCSAEEVAGKMVDAQLRPLTQTPMGFGGSVVNMTPAQMQAMAAISDPTFDECVTQLQANMADPWVQTLKDKLDARLEQVHADYGKAVQAFCSKSSDINCGPHSAPALARQFNAQAAAAGTQFLKDAQPSYAKHVKEVGDCIARREKAMGGASGGGNSALDAIFGASTGVTWGLIKLPAATNTSLCDAARKAAQKYAQ